MNFSAHRSKISPSRFNRVILFGGSSEIGRAIANGAIEEFGDSLNTTILRVQRARPPATESTGDEILLWNPRSSEEITKTVESLSLTASDLVIFSVGSLSLDGFLIDELVKSIALVEKEIFANGTLPILSLLAVSKQMLEIQGGTIVVVSSVAAFPVLESNSIYSASKRLLDEVAQSFLRSLRSTGIRLIIVRPGFVKTKLHTNRTSSPLSTSCEKVSRATLKMLSTNKSGVLWVPSSWAPVSWALSSLPFAKNIASSLFRGMRRRLEQKPIK